MVKDHITIDLKPRPIIRDDVYELMIAEAAQSQVGSHKLLFNPSLGGGMPIDKNIHIRGAFIGIDLVHTRADMIRAAMEGIALG